MPDIISKLGNRCRIWISCRLQKIQKYCGKKLWFQERLLGAASLVLSVLLGFHANSISEREAIQRWERSHLPSSSIVRFALTSQGWQEIQDQKKIEKLMRSIPVTLDEGGSIWNSSDWNWILFYSHSIDLLQVQFYCYHCSEFPKIWTPLGIGWMGFEKALEGVRLKLESEKTLLPKKIWAPWKDPREIIF